MWLCEGHASRGFQRQRSGRDFVRTLQRLWQAHGWLGANRRTALAAHLEGLRGGPPARRPGSYARPELRLEAERLYARGAAPGEVARALRRRHAGGADRPPTRRTFERWHARRRWLQREPRAP